PELAGRRVEIIPNPVNIDALRAVSRGVTVDARRDVRTGEYAVYLGKLAPNKGTSYLIDVVRRADLDWPLVIAGDGPDRTALEADARASGRRIEFRGWLDKDDATRLLARASLLIFPSRGPESLSRV